MFVKRHSYLLLLNPIKKIKFIKEFIMETLKKIFPLSFKRVDTAANLVIGILIYLVVGILAGVLIALSTMIVGWIPVVGPIIGWVLGIASSLIGLYVLAGIVIQILVFAKVIKE